MSPPAASSAPFVQSGDSLDGFLRAFWQRQIDTAEQDALTPINTKDGHAHPSLPLARIKKVMKSDPDVKQMIAADAPILFAKACEIFIAEITARAFIVADADKRRTLSRSDIAKALGKSDQFDFLIDIVPREGETPPKSSKRGKKDDDRQRSLPDIEDRPDSIEIMAHGHALDDDPDLTGVVSAGPNTGDPQLGGLAVDQMGLFDHFLNPDL